MDNKSSFSSVIGIFNKLSLQQKILMGGILIITFVLLGFVLVIFNEPSYSVLYSNLNEQDASQVVEYLTAQKVEYKIEENGQTIRIPKDKVYEVRLALAGKGVPNSGIVGYEIFDKSNMGMSDFMQKLNYRRALEGELSRTIIQQSGIEAARVHIVFPEKTVFKEDEKEPTASVVLKLKSLNALSAENVIAIAHLISSSVPGLRPAKVTILDNSGKLLSKESNFEEFGVSSTKQYEIKSSIENHLAMKAQSLLDNVLGVGNSIIRVNADVNFDQVEKTIQSYDPDNQVAVSEQTQRVENNQTDAGDSIGQFNEVTTVNYENSRTIQKVIEGTGNVKRITIAAVINGFPKQVQNGEQIEVVYEPRSSEDLKKYEDIIKQAVGFDDNRSDEMSIVSIPFETKLFETPQKEGFEPMDFLERWSNYLLVLIALGAAMFVVNGLLKKLKNEKIIIGRPTQLSEGKSELALAPTSGKLIGKLAENKKKLLEIGDIEDEISDEAALKQQRHQKISNYISKNPSEAARLINTWLHEEE